MEEVSSSRSGLGGSRPLCEFSHGSLTIRCSTCNNPNQTEGTQAFDGHGMLGVRELLAGVQKVPKASTHSSV